MNKGTSDFDLHDALLLIGLEGRTGELVVESGNNIGSLLFREGRILFAFSPYTRAIGDLLVEQGVLTETELLEVLKLQRSGPHEPVGGLLMKTGKVSFPLIEKMVHEQIRRAVKDFSAWSPLAFHFLSKEVRPFDAIHLPVFEFIPSGIVSSVLHFAAEMANAMGRNGELPAAVARH